jgi:hypothetical protein
MHPLRSPRQRTSRPEHWQSCCPNDFPGLRITKVAAYPLCALRYCELAGHIQVDTGAVLRIT